MSRRSDEAAHGSEPEVIAPPADARQSAAAPRRLSQEIDGLLAELKEGPVTLREVIAVLHGRAYTLLLILMSLPFVLPVQIPGLSTPFGAIIALIGLRLSLRLDPWLPARILDAPVASRKVAAMLKASRRVARGLEVFLRPRWSVLLDWVVLHHVYGAMICFGGLVLLLPLPIPFSNLLPAAMIILLGAAMIERDGYFAVAGFVAFILTLAFFGAIFLGGAVLVNWLEGWAGGMFDPEEHPPPELNLPVPGQSPSPDGSL